MLNHIKVDSRLTTRAPSGFYNHTAYVKDKEIVILDWVTRVKNAQRVVNNSKLRTKFINMFGKDLDQSSLVNTLVGIDTRNKEPVLVHVSDINNVTRDLIEEKV